MIAEDDDDENSSEQKSTTKCAQKRFFFWCWSRSFDFFYGDWILDIRLVRLDLRYFTPYGSIFLFLI